MKIIVVVVAAAVIFVFLLFGSGSLVNAVVAKIQEFNLGIFPFFVVGLIVILIFLVILALSD